MPDTKQLNGGNLIRKNEVQKDKRKTIGLGHSAINCIGRRQFRRKHGRTILSIDSKQ